LAQIAPKYDALLCDVWGVIHNGRRAFFPACAALAEFRATRGPVVLISNAPVPAAQVADVFPRVGVPMDCFDAIITSGDAARLELAARAPGPFWRLGTDEGFERDDYLFRDLPLSFAGPEEARYIACMGLPDPINGHPEDSRELLRAPAARGLPMLCANPDIQVRVGDKLWWCAGALARIYEELGGEVIYPGKPHAAIYALAFEELARRGVSRQAGAPSPKARVLAVGDGLLTDIRGARMQALPSLFVGTGVYQTGAEGFPKGAARMFVETGETPTYALPELCW
jgi:ribonucleotide monophosphatase NagD (HAD superfamily)